MTNNNEDVNLFSSTSSVSIQASSAHRAAEGWLTAGALINHSGDKICMWRGCTRWFSSTSHHNFHRRTNKPNESAAETSHRILPANYIWICENMGTDISASGIAENVSVIMFRNSLFTVTQGLLLYLIKLLGCAVWWLCRQYLYFTQFTERKS